MEINRNQYFLIGLVLLALGLELRMVDSVVLTPEFSTFLAQRAGNPLTSAGGSMDTITGAATQIPAQTYTLPEPIGWALLSVGAVLVLHSLAMKGPGQ